VVVAAYRRPEQLRRALRSVAAQTARAFECIVVDDASPEPLEPVVAEFDDRFRWVRQPRNTGPNGARRRAMELMRGEVLIGLDSDDEYFPWVLERVLHHLDARPDVAAVAGQYLFPDGIRGRVRGGSRVITPEDYAEGRMTLRCDLVGAFRRPVVEEWLAVTSPDYFRLEFRHWLDLGMKHRQLFVDEPWARVHFDAGPRVSTATDERIYQDAALFVRECRAWLGTAPCAPVDEYLAETWLALRRRGRPEAAVLRSWMDERGVSVRGVPARRVRERLSARIRRPVWVL
jgi:glycosyltransferase involved in cell wall biosynthesis